MPTKCRAKRLEFAPVEGRQVVAAFDGGTITSDAGALLLGQPDRAIQLIDRLAACFGDACRAELIEHEVRTLVRQRVVGIALGYEDLSDHDGLRHDPVLAVLAGKLEARREDCAPLAGKSTLNQLELSRPEPTRCHKIACHAAAIEALPIGVFLQAHRRAPAQIRGRWPRVRILLRGDSGFAREALMAWCEAHRVDCLFGLARNMHETVMSATEPFTPVTSTVRIDGQTMWCQSRPQCGGGPRVGSQVVETWPRNAPSFSGDRDVVTGLKWRPAGRKRRPARLSPDRAAPAPSPRPPSTGRNPGAACW
jgi:hypothetical protein